LRSAFAVAGKNDQDDVIYLDGYVFELKEELVLEPDNGHGFELRDGTLERPDGAEPFRLLNILAAPYLDDSDGLPVIIERVQFKNGFHNNDTQSTGVAGGAALATDRETIINNARFVNNRALGNSAGGAIRHTKLLTISNVLFVNNQANASDESDLAQGGAIAVGPNAELSITNGYFLGNAADKGGAIYASDKVVGLTISRSAFDGNQAQSFGGAIWSNVADGEGRITNSSFIANQAPLGGGALYSQSVHAGITLSHLTLWGNESDSGMGGGIRAMNPNDSGEFTLQNSLIANNVGGNCVSTDGGNLNLKDSSYNLLDDDTCGLEGVELLTGIGSVFSGKFNYYGGTIPSLPVAKDSPARNLVPRQYCEKFDSRDIPRLDNAIVPDQYCDAGAFEFVPIEHIDFDGDEVLNFNDNCVRMSNPLQSDIDGDGVGDECDGRDDRDSDLDAILNFRDNCPAVSNFFQLDFDDNGVGDACEQVQPVRLTLAPVTH